MECDDSLRELDVASLLLGIPARSNAVSGEFDRRGYSQLDRIEHALHGQTELLQREFTKLLGLQQVRCPTVFTLTPYRFRIPGIRRYQLRLYCEQPGAWHPLVGDEGCYVLTELDKWLRALAPHLNRIARLLRGAAVLAAPIMGVSPLALHVQLSDDLVRMKDLFEEISLPEDHPFGEAHDREGRRESNPRAEYDSDFRAIESLLTSLDPQRRWGGLSRTTTPEGDTLYLCRDHAASYRRPAQRPVNLGPAAIEPKTRQTVNR